MLSTFILASIEKLINTAIDTSTTSRFDLIVLTNKVLRVSLVKPDIQIDVVFGAEHIRFEPVRSAIFEPKPYDLITLPDCTLHIKTPSELITVFRTHLDDLNWECIKGDEQVFVNAYYLFKNIDILNLTDILNDFQTSSAYKLLDKILKSTT
ncbi:hypothetical protein LU293_01620 [Moraxella nasovis]|uniref:hypothetical protein n=1 Tax=Moraxella nasovis TaxID=2904121 RepID=UPI001F621B63|nr:hypothetical protein [Moraxella nasovis]UNU73637.1 hypothetical protein LU293_01620 [Moraxella nasovis]